MDIMDGPGIMTSQPELQVDTDQGVQVDAPLGSSKAVYQHPKWCCYSLVVVFNIVPFTDPSSNVHSLPPDSPYFSPLEKFTKKNA